MKKRRAGSRIFIVIVTLTTFILQGCCTVPYTGTKPSNPKFHRGSSIPPIILIANILALPYKLLLWNWHFSDRCISKETEDVLETYLKDRKLDKVNVEINRFALFSEFKRLFQNDQVALFYRIYPGIITTLIPTSLSLFYGSDFYNPFTNTVHILSNDAAIVLHEAGHAYDFSGQKYRGTYAMLRSFPFVDLYQEDLATKEAIQYLKETGRKELELHAYKTLYPALASYVGNYQASPIMMVGAIFGGHIVGRYKARERNKDFQLLAQIERTKELQVTSVDKIKT